jgi:4-hydroxy-tetrahydrodipicolinate reductase
VAPALIGKDVGELIGGEKTGVVVQDFKDMAATLKDAKADIAIIATQSLISDLEPLFTILAANSVNAATICEEAFYPWSSNPHLTEKLDKLAKAGGITFTGSGYQDVSWGSIVTALAATAASITKIKGVSSYNLEDYGLATAAAHGAGLSPQEFEEQISAVNNVSDEEMNRLIEAGEFLPAYMWSANSWIASALGLTVTRQSQKSVMTTYPEDLHSDTLGVDIPAGHATGMSGVVTTETAEGIIIEAESIGKVFAPEEIDVNQWSIEGEPDMAFVMERPATVEMTCACVVNRLPDVIAAPPGFVTSEKMLDLRQHLKF